MNKFVLKHKYITLFGTEREFNVAKARFEEVNWSDVAYPVVRPNSYRLSRLLTHLYHKDNPPSYKFEDVNDSIIEEQQKWVKNVETGEWEKRLVEVTYRPDGYKLATYRLLDHADGCIRKTFFLEIVWGYSGWEWKDYEYTYIDETTQEEVTVTLKGGNLYIVKFIETVPTIIDGYRLEHINNFLYSQYNVTKVEGFDTSNIIAMNDAFRRGTPVDVNYPINILDEIKECTLANGFDEFGVFAYHYIGWDLSKVKEADRLFYNNKIYIEDYTNTNPFIIPNIESIESLYEYGVYTKDLKFQFDKIKALPKAFRCAFFVQNEINSNDNDIDLNRIFIGDTLKKVTDFSSFFYGANICAYTTVDNVDVRTVKLDLTDSDLLSTDEINISNFFTNCRVLVHRRTSDGGRYIVSNTKLHFDINFNNPINMSNLFNGISKPDRGSDFPGGSFEQVSLNIHNKGNLIADISYGFANNKFIIIPPITQLLNDNCDDTCIYENCIFDVGVTYNFKHTSSNKRNSTAQFRKCTFNNTYNFQNLEVLDIIDFSEVKLNENLLDKSFGFNCNSANSYGAVTFRGSEFTSFLTQNLYLDTTKQLNFGDTDNNRQVRFYTFVDCKKCTDLSNINIYISGVASSKIPFLFRTQPLLVQTPYMHFSDAGYFNMGFEAAGLKHLTHFNFDYFTQTQASNLSRSMTFQDCTALVYIKIATATDGYWYSSGLDIRGCYNLDITTLESTLLKLKYCGIATVLMIMESVWNQLSQSVQDYVISQGTVNVVVDSSYTPVYPD